MFRLSFRASKGQEELDFRPTSRKKPTSDEEGSSIEKLAEVERLRWNNGGGGAAIGEVEWVPDPSTGGERALFRPVSSRTLLKSDIEQTKDAAEPESSVLTPVESVTHGVPKQQREIAEVVPDVTASDKKKIQAPQRPQRPRQKLQKANMTEEKVEYAKQVIEDAIYAEMLALDKKNTAPN